MRPRLRPRARGGNAPPAAPRRAARRPGPRARSSAREREQLAIARRPGEQRLDARQTTQIARRLRARVARERRARRAGGIAHRREQRRACPGGRQQWGRCAGGAQASVEAADQRARALDAVLAQQIEHDRVAVATITSDRIAEGGLGEHQRLGLVEHPHLRGQPGFRCVLPEQPRRERMDGADVRPRGTGATGQRPLQAQGELARSRLRVGDDEHALGCGPELERRTHALDHERRLARAGAGGDDDLAARLDGDALLVGERHRAHGFATRHTPCQRHQGGHSPSGGSCSTSPTFIRPENSAARTPASSRSCSNASAST